jgi:hypothetical protein
VGHTDDRDLLDRVVTKQHGFDFDGRNVFAAADDHVLQAIGDLHVAVGVHNGRIAGMEPAVAHALLGGLGIVVVTLHDHVAARDDLARRLPSFGTSRP